MRALVTGAAGFVGSSISAALLANGWDVRGVDAQALLVGTAMVP